MNCAERASVLSTPAYQPIQIAKRQCQLHPQQTNCILLQTKGLNKIFYEHFTAIDIHYCSINGDPYYEWLLSNDNTTREHFNNGYTMECSVKYTVDYDEVMRSIEMAGEYDELLVRKVMKFVHQYIYSDNGSLNGHAKNPSIQEESKVYVLFKDMYIHCLYSHLQCIILPQEMYCLYKDGEEPNINAAMFYKSIPEYEDTIACQHIYKGFLVYNTVLTMLLAEKNPFNDKNKPISKIIESVGVCSGGVEGGKKTRIKVCELKFATSPPPNHIMCPPRDMVKRIYTYAKWHLKPKNYTRYYAMLFDDTPKRQEQLREWSIFINEFKTHFFPTQ
ncbi:vp1054 [Cryptophlebia leucotreta granulovirus]|uniref:Vp1054 n=1 Tax=Cryptophlebia leucotreta granulosis virus TaxID=35254 RepID=Q7T5G8_GVCL|nr:vp1054 [Cryptophlebia leucotreta granulovirus]AAQ21720.1 vp1054 [Cryptophlebia leucotreta granulovirus]